MTPRDAGAGGAPAGLRGADQADLAELAAFVEEALSEPLDREAVRVVTVPAPVAPPEGLVPADGPAIFWTTPGAPVHVGLGAAVAIAGTGNGRFREVRESADRLWDRLAVVAHPDAAPTAPLLFGGFAFLPGPLPAEWQAFGEATFILPRMRYTVHDGRATVSMAVTGATLEGTGRERVVAEVRSLLGRLEGAASRPAPPAERLAPRGGGVPSLDRTAWDRAVASIQARIAEGRADKIVAARSRAVPLATAGDVPTILRRLDQESATAARFAFRLTGGTFVGATPERLVGRTGREIRTEALAGSVAADTPELEERLVASLKEEAEHDYVVRAIAGALEPLCERLERPGEPRVQRLRHVLHLQTPFVGRLRDDVHVLELVERLHPTPAVGGWPTAEALAWIRSEEPGSRGWYAAPVGWFDAGGDGEFGVALRSGLLHDDRAWLYAGAGIVSGSDAAAEFEETEVKLRTMLDALGLRT